MAVMAKIILVLFLAYGINSKSDSAAAPALSSKCFGTWNSCTYHHFICLYPSYIVISSANYGFKSSGSNCPRTLAWPYNCTNINVSTCCQQQNDDCLLLYSNSAFSSLYQTCWGKHDCQPHSDDSPAIGSYVGNCSGDGKQRNVSSYSLIKHTCMSDTSQILFLENRTVQGNTVVARFDDSQNQWIQPGSTCLVEANDCSRILADITVIRNYNGRRIDSDCWTIKVDNEDMLQCGNKNFVYNNITKMTPFEVSLDIHRSRPPKVALTLIAAIDTESILTMTCGGDSGYIQHISRCAGTTATVRTSSTILPTIPTTTTLSTLKTIFSTTTPSTVNTTSPSSTTTNTTDIGTLSVDGTKDNTNVGAIAGAVVGSIAVLALIVILVICLIKRSRKHTANKAKHSPSGKIIGLANTRDGQFVDFATTNPGYEADYEYCSTEIQNLSASGEPDYANTITSETGETSTDDTEATDYNRLGEIKTKTDTTSNMYGHLGMNLNEEVTDYNYDHLSRGNGTDVINGDDYDTAKIVTSHSVPNYELAADFVVADDVTNSPYELSQPIK